jgi:hypothetical protein
MAVYFIRNQKDHVKIGHSKDPRKRLADLQSACSDRLRLGLIVASWGRLEEQALHKRFGAFRIRGEWFDGLHNDLHAFEVDMDGIGLGMIEQGYNLNPSDCFMGNVMVTKLFGDWRIASLITACAGTRERLRALACLDRVLNECGGPGAVLSALEED